MNFTLEPSSGIIIALGNCEASESTVNATFTSEAFLCLAKYFWKLRNKCYLDLREYGAPNL